MSNSLRELFRSGTRDGTRLEYRPVPSQLFDKIVTNTHDIFSCEQIGLVE